MDRFVWRQQCIACLLALGLAPQAFAQTSPQRFTLQGQILKPDNTPLETSSVSFTLQIRSPGSESCILFEETQVVNMTNSSGIFSLAFGGPRSGTGFKNTSTLAQVFSNSIGLLTSLTCVSGSSYTPVSGDQRKFRLTFDDGSGAETFAQDLTVQAVPYALYADSLQGKTPANFIQSNTVSAALSQANAEAVFSSSSAVNELLALMNGTSTHYTNSSGANFTPAANLDFNAKKITNLANPTSAQDAVTKNYSDSRIGGATADSASLAALTSGDNGKVLTWDGTKWVATAGSDVSRVAKTGDTMTGTLTLNNADLSLTGTAKINGQMSVMRTARDTQGSTNILNLSTDAKSAGDEVGLNFTMRNSTNTATAYGMIYSGITSPSAGAENGYLRFLVKKTSGMSEALHIDGQGRVGVGTTPQVGVDLSGSTDALRLPAGTTLQRPLSPAAGDLRWNTTTPGLEFYNGSTWGTMSDATTLSGDVSGPAHAASVDKIKGKAVTAPTVSGQVLRYDGSAITPNFVAVTDLRSTVTGSQALPSTCSASQTLTYNTSTDSLACSNIAISNSQVSGLGTAATLSTGTSANNLVQLDSSSKLPAVDGSALTALNATNITTGTLSASRLASSVYVNGGNAFGSAGNIGTTDAQPLNFVTSGAPRLTILADGKVGIGTTGPSALLDVQNAANAATYSSIKNSDTGNAVRAFGRFSNGTNYVDIGTYGTAHGSYPGVSYISSGASTPLQVQIGGVDVMNFATSGKVGIGTTSPSAPMQIVAASGSDLLKLSGAGGAIGESYYLKVASRVPGSGNIAFDFIQKNNASEMNTMTFESNGNVGIGTTAPLYRLHVNGVVRADGNITTTRDAAYSTWSQMTYGPTQSGNIQIDRARGTEAVPSAVLSGDAIGSYRFNGYGTSAWAVGEGVASIRAIAMEDFTDATRATDLTFSTTHSGSSNASERVRISSIGHVGIGTTTPQTTLDVSTKRGAGYGIRIGDASDSNNLRSEIRTSSSGNGVFALRNNVTTETVLLHSSGDSYLSGGNVGIGITVPTEKLHVAGDIKVGTSGTNGCVKNFAGTGLTGTCSSDERLKKNIEPLMSVSESLAKVQPAFYEWRVEEFPDRHFGHGKQIGVIAQQVQSVMPELVEQDEDGYLKVKYQDFSMYLLKGFSEHHAKLKEISSLCKMSDIQLSQIHRSIASLQEKEARQADEIARLKAENARMQSELAAIKRKLGL